MTDEQQKIYEHLNKSYPIKCRKKPLIVESFQYQGTVIDIPWIEIDIPRKEYDCCYIKTLEGITRCEIGDYIIKGIKGEFYSVRKDIFEASYDLVEEKTE